MTVIDNEYIVCYDIDDTLVKWDGNHTQPHEGSIEFLDPYDQSTNHLVPYQKHIDLLKKHKGRGMFVIVWSAGGVKWAETVIKKLELEKFVDIVATKPTKYVDDIPCQEWMGHRIYLK